MKMNSIFYVIRRKLEVGFGFTNGKLLCVFSGEWSIVSDCIYAAKLIARSSQLIVMQPLSVVLLPIQATQALLHHGV